MNILHLLKDPPIQIILTVFFSAFGYTVKSYIKVYKQLNLLNKGLESFTKDNISYKFEEFKHVMTTNPLSAKPWDDFQSTLVFSDTIAYQDSDTEELDYDSVSDSMSDIQTTSDALDYFNEDTLAYAHYNKHIIALAPTLLTGFGPLFTFIMIGTAFGMLDFSSNQALTKSIAGFVGTMQVAAMCSVFAVASALIFMSVDKFSFSRFILPLVAKVQNKVTDLFTTISAEKFLVDLLKTTKTQSHDNASLLKNLPTTFTSSIKKDLTNIVVPYLDSVIFGINNLNKTMEKKSSSEDDDLNGLF